jgi:hypothetical protein
LMGNGCHAVTLRGFGRFVLLIFRGFCRAG